MNKKLLLILSVNTFCSIMLLIIIRVLLNIGYFINYIGDSFILMFAIICMVFFLIFYNNELKKAEISLLDVMLPVIFSFILYVIYLIPPLNFVDVKGINNSVISIFFFSIMGRFCYNMSYYKEKNNRVKTINNSFFLAVKNYNSYYIKIAGTLTIVMGVVLAVFNLFTNKIDLSFPVQMLFMGKSMAESFQ